MSMTAEGKFTEAHIAAENGTEVVLARVDGADGIFVSIERDENGDKMPWRLLVSAKAGERILMALEWLVEAVNRAVDATGGDGQPVEEYVPIMSGNGSDELTAVYTSAEQASRASREKYADSLLGAVEDPALDVDDLLQESRTAIWQQRQELSEASSAAGLATQIGEFAMLKAARRGERNRGIASDDEYGSGGRLAS